MSTRSKRVPRRLAACLAAAGLLAAAGCGGDDSSSDTTTADDTTAPATTAASTAAPATGEPSTTAGGTSAPTTEAPDPAACTGTGELRFGAFAEPPGLDPVKIGGGLAGGTEAAAIFDTLTRWDPATKTYVPQLAESVEGNADSTVWTIKLRDGVKFGNGEPVTADTVKASIDRHLDPALRSRSAGLLSLVSAVAVVDMATVSVTLTAGWPGFPAVLAQAPGMVTNPSVIAALGPDAFSALPAGAGAGPFEITKWAPGEGMEMSAKADYYGGKVCAAKLEVSVVNGSDATMEAFDTDGLDVAIVNEPKALVALEDSETQHTTRFAGVGVIIMNNGVRESVSPTTDPRIREAVTLALDPAAIDERADGGAGRETTALVPPGDDHFAGIEGPTANADQAKALVEQVIAEGAWDGTIRYRCHSALEENAIAVEALLTRAGFKVQRNSGGTSTELIKDVIIDANFDLACFGVRYSANDPWPNFSAAYASTGRSNYSGYKNADMDAALDELRVAADDAGRAAAMGDIQKVWNTTFPGAVVRASDEAVVWRDEVSGVVYGADGIVYLDTVALAG